MFLDLHLGPLSEPLTGRHWDRTSVLAEYRRRLVFYDRCGLAGGDRVFVHYGNTLEFFVDLAALWSLGACVVPIDPQLTAFEIETLARAASPRFSLWFGEPEHSVALALSGIGVIVVDTSQADATAAVGWDRRRAERSPAVAGWSLDTDALILFTSGTTGQPKGVVHTHRSLRARWTGLLQALGLRPYRRTLCLLPTHFGHGLICNSLFPWLFGQHLFIVPPFRPDLVLQLGQLLDEHGITFLSSVPPVWRLALRTAAPPRAATLERVFCGSAPLSAALWQDIRTWAGADVWNAYGITETGSWLAGTSVANFTPADGLVGVSWGGVVKVLPSAEPGTPGSMQWECDPGESGYIWVNTPALMRGYFERADLTAQVVSAGWFLTGDIGSLDERGWLHLRGRAREEINKGGLKVYPSDIDLVVERFAGAVDVCTFAVEDLLLGEDVGLAVVLHEPSPATFRRLHEWLEHHLAKHQMPRRCYVVDEIARTSRGKLNRAQVAARCASLEPVDLRRPTPRVT